MEYKEIINRIKPEMDKAMAYLDKELAKIRTGRASVSIVEDLAVECFGQRFPLKQLAMISVPESRQIVVQPWDASYFEPIQKAISESALGLSPVADKNVIRINMPDLTGDYRVSLARVIAKTQEDARQTIRKLRDQAWSEVQKKEREGEIREDDKFKAKDDLQEMIDNYSKKIEESGERKKKEIAE